MNSITPPTSIHIALPVGGKPVKNEEMEMPEASDCNALIPKITSTTPPTRSARKNALSARENALDVGKPSFIRLQNG
jgi:hypothetical protein